MEGQRISEGQISSDFTTASSEEFPHTKPIQVQHAKYDFDVQHSVQMNRDEIARILPGDIVQHLPEGVEQLTPEDIARLLPEGATQLRPEDIAERLQAGVPTQQPGQPRQEQPNATPQQPGQPNAAPQQPEAPAPEPEQQEEPQEQETEQTQGISEVESRVIELTNQERRNNGLPDLQADASLSNVARVKSKDMQENNYFSHTSPTYGSPFDMMRDFDISYNSAGENIAQGQRSPEEVVQAWMNSEGHRANIMNGDYTHIGVGYHQNGNYWTQMFISK
ncbi:CAP domain-containing protein [Halalkalibacter kiskunsagensis]|uniref:CAP domain-containing protein n=1 Tax=Halalkalibacter kiskunsagensis TaxID=1548599 RepID=A0ABV6KA54_9BACI